MIIVTGATGHLGRAVVEKLVERVPADQVGASVRDPGKAAALEALGVRVRQGDFSDPRSLRHAFMDATQVLIVSSNARASGGDTLAQHRNAIEAARTAGARRIAYTSHMAASATSAFPPMLDHAATEQMLQQSGLAWTALRHGFYAASGLMLMDDAFKTGVIEAPADGKVAWTAHADLAEAAAAILAGEARFDGPTPPLTGSRSLDMADLAALAQEALGRPVERRLLIDDEFKAKLAARGVPGGAVPMALGLFAASRRGEFETTDPTLERLLGRRPASMQSLISEKAAKQGQA